MENRPGEEFQRKVSLALENVIDPELGDNIVSLGMYLGASIDQLGTATIKIGLTAAKCPLRSQIKADIEQSLAHIPEIRRIEVAMGELTKDQKSRLMDIARKNAQNESSNVVIPQSSRIIAISSGKGGVGKSSLTANLAAAMAFEGYKVGVLDADIWGFSLPRMLGVSGRIEAEGTKDSWRMTPIKKQIGKGELQIISMGFLAQGDSDAIMWRGLMLSRALQHFIENVSWSSVDYLLIDMPPGTGDIQMALSRMLPRTEMVIVTTPAMGASIVASRMGDMAKKGHLRIAGVVENMSGFTCGHGENYHLFGSGGGQEVANQLGTSLIGQIPFTPSIARLGDNGVTLVETELEHEHEKLARNALIELADNLVTKIAPLYEVQSCTARMIDAINASLGPL
ncbi:MAG: Mrp/NBP35 family ATP-binding protein [Acidimicrobiaceae bacterium]|nr:Mrp/NBP35 family ATP-binding protein [Acidimicrobiaceae bacterium]